MELYFYPARGKTIYYQDPKDKNRMIEAGTTDSYPIGSAVTMTEYLRVSRTTIPVPSRETLPKVIVEDLLFWLKDMTFHKAVEEWVHDHPSIPLGAVLKKSLPSCPYDFLNGWAILMRMYEKKEYVVSQKNTKVNNPEFPFLTKRKIKDTLNNLLQEAIEEDGLF